MESCNIYDDILLDINKNEINENININDLLCLQSELEKSKDLEKLLNVNLKLVLYYAKHLMKDLAYQAINKVLGLLKELDLINTMAMACAYINIADSYKMLEDYENSLQFYQGAFEIWEDEKFNKYDYRYIFLCNNYALVLKDVKKYKSSLEYFNEALDLIKDVDNLTLEMAIIYLNIINLEFTTSDNKNIISNYLNEIKYIIDGVNDNNHLYSYVHNRYVNLNNNTKRKV